MTDAERLERVRALLTPVQALAEKVRTLPWSAPVEKWGRKIMVSCPITTPRGQMVLSANGLPAEGEMQDTVALMIALSDALPALMNALAGEPGRS